MVNGKDAEGNEMSDGEEEDDEVVSDDEEEDDDDDEDDDDVCGGGFLNGWNSRIRTSIALEN